MRIYKYLALWLIAQIYLAALSEVRGAEPQYQADVYDELYEAYVQCDDNLDQSRSEFITDMFERNRGNKVTMELLKKLLAHNIQVVKQALTEKLQEREHYLSLRLQELQEPPEDRVGSVELFKTRQKQLKNIDEVISEKRQYIEIRECVLAIL